MDVRSGTRSTRPVRSAAASGSLLCQALIVLLATIGAVDAAVGSSWDLVVIFVAVIGLGAAGLARSWARRSSVSVRGDLVTWLDQRAAANGERIEDVADRAVAASRAGISDDPVGGP